jgi:hypothetical protein
MTSIHRLVGAATTWAILIGVVVACSNDLGRRKTEAHHPPNSLEMAGTTSVANTQTQWDSAAGLAIVLAVDSVPDSVSVIRPEYIEGRYSDTTVIDLRSLAHARFDLFGRNGTFGTAVLATSRFMVPRGSEDGCVQWPTATLPTTKRGWHVALETGHASAIQLDSIEGMSPSDSAIFAAQVTRVVSTLPELRDPVFNNVPFVVRSAYRFQTTVIEGIVASTQRDIPSEATPREEHVFLIAERPVGSSDDYHIVFSTRNAGTEGSTPVTNVLAAVILNQVHRVAIIVSNEYEDGGAVALIERISPRQWRLTWHSAYAGC